MVDDFSDKGEESRNVFLQSRVFVEQDTDGPAVNEGSAECLDDPHIQWTGLHLMHCYGLAQIFEEFSGGTLICILCIYLLANLIGSLDSVDLQVSKLCDPEGVLICMFHACLGVDRKGLLGSREMLICVSHVCSSATIKIHRSVDLCVAVSFSHPQGFPGGLLSSMSCVCSSANLKVPRSFDLHVSVSFSRP